MLAPAADGVGERTDGAEVIDAPRQLRVGIHILEEARARPAGGEKAAGARKEVLAYASQKGGDLAEQIGACVERVGHADVLREEVTLRAIFEAGAISFNSGQNSQFKMRPEDLDAAITAQADLAPDPFKGRYPEEG